MNIVNLIHFLLLLSIPAVGGLLLYIDLRYNKLLYKSVKYGGIYAIFIFCFMMADNSLRIVGNTVDKVLYADCKTMSYIVRNDRSEDALKLDEMRLKVNDAKTVDACTEQRLCSRYSWNVIRYVPGKNEMQ